MKITIIGYGIQGEAQALNLRDSGHDVIIANRDDSYHKNASKDGFDVVSINQSISSSEIIFLLIPDAVQEEIIQAKDDSSLFDNAATSIFFSSSFLCPPFGKHTFNIPAVKPYSLHRGFNHSGIAFNLASRFFSSPARINA